MQLWNQKVEKSPAPSDCSLQTCKVTGNTKQIDERPEARIIWHYGHVEGIGVTEAGKQVVNLTG